MFRDADAAAGKAQKSFLWVTGAVIASSLIAALCGAIGGDWTGFVGASAFLVALAGSYYLLKHNPERNWYDGRAVAESAKTLGWQFMVGGGDFSRAALDDEEAAKRVVSALTAVRGNLGNVAPVPKGPVEQVTQTMRDLRASSLEQRKASYRQHRLEAQRDWYSSGAKLNDKRRKQWGVASAGFQTVGFLAALATGFGWLNFDLLGIAAAGGVGAATWLRAKDHAELARAYAVAAHDLSGAQVRVDAATTEDEWAAAVHDAESAISREHTRWIGRRHLRSGV